MDLSLRLKDLRCGELSIKLERSRYPNEILNKKHHGHKNIFFLLSYRILRMIKKKKINLIYIVKLFVPMKRSDNF
jgi:hypothetical protein